MAEFTPIKEAISACEAQIADFLTKKDRKINELQQKLERVQKTARDRSATICDLEIDLRRSRDRAGKVEVEIMAVEAKNKELQKRIKVLEDEQRGRDHLKVENQKLQ